MLTRWTVLLALLALIGLAQWITPMKGSVGLPYLAVHLLLRKLYLLPIILGAIWFELPGALAMALGASLVDLPALLAAWPGLPEERLEEWGGLGGMWIVAVVAGVEVHKARSILLRLNCALECTIESLVAALDIREQGTGLHSRRVREISLWLARRLGLSEGEYEAIRHGALLHDVGKIGIPDQILLKAGPLTATERTVMDRHPELGMRIIEANPLLKDAAAIVQCHHERYDGSGYPRGLVDGQIPLGARIFAVADVLDALTAPDRPYRAPVSYEEARQWIVQQSGKLFDPSVIQALRDLTPEEWRELNQQVDRDLVDFRRLVAHEFADIGGNEKKQGKKFA